MKSSGGKQGFVCSTSCMRPFLKRKHAKEDLASKLDFLNVLDDLQSETTEVYLYPKMYNYNDRLISVCLHICYRDKTKQHIAAIFFSGTPFKCLTTRIKQFSV